ncbi:hypothetical protein BKA62DRAFT_394880 [Auriculariales sp. MPI-PUGE-AT-0066]|nr:hypothetical protein BKA62DRAFT_394880 [Auriculariales sp. MPI-PUGE-AT-0066]
MQSNHSRHRRGSERSRSPGRGREGVRRGHEREGEATASRAATYMAHSVSHTHLHSVDHPHPSSSRLPQHPVRQEEAAMASHRAYAHPRDDRRDDRYPQHVPAQHPPPPDPYAGQRHDPYYDQRTAEEAWDRQQPYQADWAARVHDPYALRPEERGWMPPAYSRSHYDEQQERWHSHQSSAHDARYNAPVPAYDDGRRHHREQHWEVDPAWSHHSRPEQDPVNNWQPAREEQWPVRHDTRDREPDPRPWEPAPTWHDRSRDSYHEHNYASASKREHHHREPYQESRTYDYHASKDYNRGSVDYNRQLVFFLLIFPSLEFDPPAPGLEPQKPNRLRRVTTRHLRAKSDTAHILRLQCARPRRCEHVHLPGRGLPNDGDTPRTRMRLNTMSAGVDLVLENREGRIEARGDAHEVRHRLPPLAALPQLRHLALCTDCRLIQLLDCLEMVYLQSPVIPPYQTFVFHQGQPTVRRPAVTRKTSI